MSDDLLKRVRDALRSIPRHEPRVRGGSVVLLRDHYGELVKFDDVDFIRRMIDSETTTEEKTMKHSRLH